MKMAWRDFRATHRQLLETALILIEEIGASREDLLMGSFYIMSPPN
jgi:hypothetical protein